MAKAKQTLADNPTWEKLLHSAENSIGKTSSYYESPEPKLFDELIAEANDDKAFLVEQVREMLTADFDEDSWAAIKEGATLLHHLQLLGYKPEDDWESVINELWLAMGTYGQSKWSDFVTKKNAAEISISWKRIKFVLDALISTLLHINQNDDDRIERFFNSKMNSYWKAFHMNWGNLWGAFNENRNTYFQASGNRHSDKLTYFQLIIFRIVHAQDEFPAHLTKALHAIDLLKAHQELIPEEKSMRKELFHALLTYWETSKDQGNLVESLASVREISGDDDSFEFVMGNEEFEAVDRGWLLLSFKDLESRWRGSRALQQQLFPDLLAALTHDDLNVREQAIAFLNTRAKALFRYLRHMENEGAGVPVFQAMCAVFEQDVVQLLLKNFSFTPPEKGKFLLEAPPRILEGRWEEKTAPNYQDILPFILATVESGEPSCQKKAGDFLKRKSTVIQQQLDELIDSLDQNEDKANEMIASAIEFGSDSALKAILEKCIIWIASDQNGTLVDRAAQKARQTPDAVSALVNLLNNNQNLYQNLDVQEYIRWKVLKTQKNPTLKHIFEKGVYETGEKEINSIDSYHLEELYNWCYSLKEKAKAYTDLIVRNEKKLHQNDGKLKAQPTFLLAKSIMDLLEEEELKQRELAVQKWITQLLSEMSDSWFFEGKKDVYAQAKKQLERLAIEPLSKRLPQEENLDIRENLVKILGNIGGRVAVDALVRTVTGEERERAARQEMLSEYYLKPSKARSEEAAKLLQDAVENAKKTMRLLQNLNMATFMLGALLIIAGVGIAVVSKEMGGRITGAIAGVGGLGAILTQFMKDPMERIQRAMADLVQVQTAFTSFVWELNLNGTYIQSQYVAEGVLTDFDIRQTVERIDHAMERTMELIQVYADGQSLDEENMTDIARQVAGNLGEVAVSKLNNGQPEKTNAASSK